MDFGEVLQRAWKIIWKHKALWIFGILAGCGSSGNSGSGGSGASQSRYNFNNGGSLPPEWNLFFNRVGQFFSNIPVWFWFLLAALLVLLILVAIVLNTVGRIGLIKGASMADEDAQRLSFGELFTLSLPYFWRIFLLNLLVFLVFFALILVSAVPIILLTAVTLGIALLCLIPLFCLLIPVMWVVNVIIEQANIAVVVENRDIISGLQRGWDVVIHHLGAIIVMALILFIGGAVAGFVIALPFVLILLPPLVGVALGGSRAIANSILIAVVIALVYLPFAILLGGILRSYISTAWTLTFRRLTGRGPGALAPVQPAPPLPPIAPPPMQETAGPTSA